MGSDNVFRRFSGGVLGVVAGAPCARLRLLISVDAEILTNNHVVAGADEIRVGLFRDERKSSVAGVVGRDPLTDTARIELTKRRATCSRSTTRTPSRPADWAMA